MTDAAYVLGGWAITVVALGGYAARVAIRSRRLRRLAPPEERGREWT